jgi:hypothetical protein
MEATGISKSWYPFIKLQFHISEEYDANNSVRNHDHKDILYFRLARVPPLSLSQHHRRASAVHGAGYEIIIIIIIISATFIQALKVCMTSHLLSIILNVSLSH